jgi:hypothetical protein
MYIYLYQANTNIERVWGEEGSALFFRSEILREDPGVLFYIWSLVYRTSPIVLLGLAITLGGTLLSLFPQRWQKSNLISLPSILSLPYFPAVLLIFAYTIFYFLAMSLGVSKVDRYLIPIFPGLSILAAVGFQLVVNLFSASAYLNWLKWGIWGLVLIGNAWLALPQHPYYFTYWNPLLGGGQKAAKVLPVGGR